jgi:glycerol kinase
MRTLIAAIDQGTTSTRCIVYEQDFTKLASAHREHRQSLPQPGWVEHDAAEILANTEAVVAEALATCAVRPGELAAVGITNQRETFLLWNRKTGEPCAPAIVWQDSRSKAICDELREHPRADEFAARTGLPISTYFSGPKLAWLLRERSDLRAAAERGELAFGTLETWLIWNLSGGPDGGVHVTDLTNACRTFLVDIDAGAWDAELLEWMGVPAAILPRIVANAEPGGWAQTSATGPFGSAVPICGAIGDQQGALVGQRCFESGDAKNTYGTGCFLLWNTAGEAVRSKAGMLTTVGYQLPGAAPCYALEGSVAVAGSLIQWLRDQLGVIDRAADVEALARSVPDHGDVHLVPAFSGLFAPRWRPDARGVICGLTHHSSRAHIARAALESTAFQVREVIDAMHADTGSPVSRLRVDGGMAANDLLLAFQADLLGVPVERGADLESTALGAATMAALAQDLCPDSTALRAARSTQQVFEPQLARDRVYERMRDWHKAVERSLNWVADAP